MSGTTQSSTAAYIDGTGIHAPAFEDVFTYLQTQFRSIYGNDIYLGNDSQDGQLIGVLATAVNDTNAMAIGVYNSFSPTTAQAVGLSSNVKINGITRLVPTPSTVDLLIGGTVGTQITNGYVTDLNGIRWYLPQIVVIPAQGSITVTATCASVGATQAGPDTINTIGTPVRGWQTVTNPGAATPGQPVESDAALRRRQATSTMQPAQTPLEAIAGAVSGLSGVVRLQPYENNTNLTDANGLPPHSIALVVDGGDVQQIAATIAKKKTPGAYTYGTTSAVIVDQFAVPNTINFSRPVLVSISASIRLTPYPGYTTQVGLDVVNAFVDYVNAQPIGEDVLLSRATVAIGSSKLFNLTQLTLSRDFGALNQADVPIAFNEAASASINNITLTVG